MCRRRTTTRTRGLDALETWSEIPVKIQTIMEYDVVKARARVVPFRIERLPLSYLKDGA